MWRSLSSCFEVVPDATSAWKPEHAPHATVTNSSGKTYIVEPPRADFTAKLENASMFIDGQTTNTAVRPIASMAYRR